MKVLVVNGSPRVEKSNTIQLTNAVVGGIKNIILSFPLYFFGMPGSMKTFVDRLMPLMETYRGTVKDIGDNAFHEFRYDMGNKKFVVVSSCGYGRTNEIFDALIKEFNFIYGKDRYTALLCRREKCLP
mgnify:CR=1 FL=1